MSRSTKDVGLRGLLEGRCSKSEGNAGQSRTEEAFQIRKPSEMPPTELSEKTLWIRGVSGFSTA